MLSVLRTCSALQKSSALEVYDHIAEKIGHVLCDLWSSLLSTACEIGAFDRCKEFYRRLRMAGVEPTGNDVVNIVRSLAHTQTLSGLKAILADLSDAQYTFGGVVRNRCLTACCADNAFDLAFVIIGSDVFCDHCDAAGYNTVMRSLMRRGQSSRCLELYEEMLSHMVTPTEVTLTVLLESAVRNADLAQARQFMDNFIEFGVAPNRIHYTTLLRGLVLAGKEVEVNEIFQFMDQGPESTSPDLITFQTVVKAYANLGDVSSAVRTIKRAIKRGVQPDEYIFHTALYACSVARMKFPDVLRIFDQLVSYGFTPSASSLAVLTHSLDVKEDWNAAVKMFDCMQRRFGVLPEARTYAVLGLACLKADEFALCKDVHGAMLKALGSSATIESASARLLHGCVCCQTLAEAKSVAFQNQRSHGRNQHSGKSRSKVVPASLPCCASPRLAQFVAVNDLDARCDSLLRSIPAQQAEWVMDQGFTISVDPTRGTASARVVGLVQRSKQASVCWQFYPDEEASAKRFDEFVTLNSLNRDCVDTLAKLCRSQRHWVMDQGFLVQTSSAEVSASAAVKTLSAFSSTLDQNNASFAELVGEYIAVNKLDEQCVTKLKSLSCADVAHVIDQGGFHLTVNWSKGTASANVVSMITKLKAGDNR
jgi:pentatricopeptide repeat protein